MRELGPAVDRLIAREKARGKKKMTPVEKLDEANLWLVDIKNCDPEDVKMAQKAVKKAEKALEKEIAAEEARHAALEARLAAL